MEILKLQKQEANDIKLERNMYETAYKNGMTFSQLLETINPSKTEDKLDAFERQCKRFGIILKNIAEKGIWASKGEFFFQSNRPESRILFPEYINRVARATILEDYSIQDIVANIRPIDSGSFRSLYIDDTKAKRQKARVAQGAGFPKTTVSWSEQAGAVKKFGIEIDMSYEFVRRCSLPLLEIVLQRILLQNRVDEFTDAVNVLAKGDDHANPANPAPEHKLTELDPDATAGTLTYKGYLKFGNLFRPGRCNVAIGNINTILKVILCAKPSADPIQLYALLSDKRTILGEDIELVNPVWTKVRFIIHDDVPDDKLLGIDKRYALEKITEIGADLTETDRLIDTQFDKIVLSESINFSKIFNSASKILAIDL